MKSLNPYYGNLGLSFLFAFLLILPVVPILHQGFFPIHDDTQVARVYEMGKALSDGMFPVRWVMDLGYGYGYPLFNFYAPFSYYVGGFLNLLGLPAIISTKIMMIAGIIFSGLSMFLLGHKLWGKFGGFLSAILYLYAPYHAVQIYVRGAVAEYFAYGFIPLIFYFSLKYLEKKNTSSLILGALSFSALVLSHNLTAFMVSPFYFLFLLALVLKDKKFTKGNLFLFLIPLLGIMLSAFYSFPAIAEVQYTNLFSRIGGSSGVENHFVCLQQLWNSPWGYGGSAPGCIDGMSFKIGKVHLLLTLTSLALIFLYRKLARDKMWIVLVCFIFLITSIFLTTEYSRFVWQNFPSMQFLQFPWRFLVLISFFSSILSGGTFYIFKKTIAKKNNASLIPFFLLAVFLICYFNLKYFVPSEIKNLRDQDYTSSQALKWDASRLSDEYLPKNFKKPKSPEQVPSVRFVIPLGNGEIKNEEFKTGAFKVETTGSQKTELKINLAYFPSWQIYLNGKKTEFEILDDGIMVDVPKSKNIILGKFEETRIEKISDLLSFLGIIGISFLILKKKVYG